MFSFSPEVLCLFFSWISTVALVFAVGVFIGVVEVLEDTLILETDYRCVEWLMCRVLARVCCCAECAVGLFSTWLKC